MSALLAILAALSIWEYPARQAGHESLVRSFAEAARAGDSAAMVAASRAGTELLPEDPTWRYNLACSLVRNREPTAALDALEQAIDLGFRSADRIAADSDLAPLKSFDRFGELVGYARRIADRQLLTGPLAAVPANGEFGRTVIIGGHNLGWDFDTGSFVARMRFQLSERLSGNAGDLYVNRDGGHSQLKAADFPGLTEVRLDAEGVGKGADRNFPNTRYPLPVFGNASLAFVEGPFWRSLPRAMLTVEARRLKAMAAYYASNQFWVFPANADCPPVGTNGDVFASIAPYWIVSAGKSYSDQNILRAALEASRTLPAQTKAEAVRRGLLAPTIQQLIRSTMPNVKTAADYLGPKAHPTALAACGPDLARLKAIAASLSPEAIPPLAAVAVADLKPPAVKPSVPELTYMSPFAWAFVLRSPERQRRFSFVARGAAEYAFSVVRDDIGAVIERDSVAVVINKTGRFELELDRARLTPTNRVDVAVFGRNPGTRWSAPAYVSFAVVDGPGYVDPALVPSVGKGK